MKYLFVTGGVASGIGKGTIASSIGLLLQSHKKLNGQHYRVSAIKIDPYLNKNAGNMSPHEHGEVYVLNDGTETDLDLGNYERFLGIDLTSAHSITTGQIYDEVIKREERGVYLGKTVQIVPHITDHIIERIDQAATVPVADVNGVMGVPDIVIIELGGTVGDMESEPFLYAISRFAMNRNSSSSANVAVLHVGLLVANNGEAKTKPLQHSMQAMRARGVFPDVLCVRCDLDTPTGSLRSKLSSACHVPLEHVVFSGRIKSVYEVPKILQQQHVCTLLYNRLGLTMVDPDFRNYNLLLDYFNTRSEKRLVKIDIIAKYSGADTYLSLYRALEHAAFAQNVALDIQFVDAANAVVVDRKPDGIVIPGGFGDRGIEGKIAAISKAREHKIPVLGLCLGMQLLAIEEARQTNPKANSAEFIEATATEAKDNVVVKFADGKMRLGLSDVHLKNTTIKHFYGGDSVVKERHRHRYHVDVSKSKTLEHCVAGVSVIPEIMIFPCDDLSDWRAIGVQFHPEYLSRNFKPHPIFVEFLRRITP